MKKYIVIISENKKIMGGAPCIDQTRLPIWLLKGGLSWFKKSYPIRKNAENDWWKKSLFELKADLRTCLTEIKEKI